MVLLSLNYDRAIVGAIFGQGQFRARLNGWFSVVPARRWLNSSWPALLWPPRWDMGYWDGSRNIHSGSLWPVCWSFVFSSCADTNTSDLELVLFCFVAYTSCIISNILVNTEKVTAAGRVHVTHYFKRITDTNHTFLLLWNLMRNDLILDKLVNQKNKKKNNSAWKAGQSNHEKYLHYSTLLPQLL